MGLSAVFVTFDQSPQYIDFQQLEWCIVFAPFYKHLQFLDMCAHHIATNLNEKLNSVYFNFFTQFITKILFIGNAIAHKPLCPL